MSVDEQRLRDAIPSWVVVFASDTRVCVRSPTFAVDGMVLEGRDVEEVVQRVRNVERIWALALDRAGSTPVQWPSAGVGRDKAPASKPPTKPLAYIPEGDACSYCGGMQLVRSGTCMTCQTCGTTTGCS